MESNLTFHSWAMRYQVRPPPHWSRKRSHRELYVIANREPYVLCFPTRKDKKRMISQRKDYPTVPFTEIPSQFTKGRYIVIAFDLCMLLFRNVRSVVVSKVCRAVVIVEIGCRSGSLKSQLSIVSRFRGRTGLVICRLWLVPPESSVKFPLAGMFTPEFALSGTNKWLVAPAGNKEKSSYSNEVH